jgi:hypothetical protein
MMSIFVFEEKRKQLNKKEYAPFFSVKKSPATIDDELCDSWLKIRRKTDIKEEKRRVVGIKSQHYGTKRKR